MRLREKAKEFRRLVRRKARALWFTRHANGSNASVPAQSHSVSAVTPSNSHPPPNSPPVASLTASSTSLHSSNHQPVYPPISSLQQPVGTTPPPAPLPATGTLNEGWSALKASLGALRGVYGPIEGLINPIIELSHVFENQSKNQQEYKKLQDELQEISQKLQDLNHQIITSPRITEVLLDFNSSIQRELTSMKERQDRVRLNRYREAIRDSDTVSACHHRINGYVRKLLFSLFEQQNDRVSQYLNRLKPSMPACYNSDYAEEVQRGECTPGTRTNVLARLRRWSEEPALGGAVYWLNGMAGTGKTTIAYSFCRELDSNHELAASFFCSRTHPECRDIMLIIPSISYQLARFSPEFCSALLNVLENNPDLHQKELLDQFGSLISKPLMAIRPNPPRPFVVVIDALDECDPKNPDVTRKVLDILLTHSKTLPIKFFISSRPEPLIRDRMADVLGGQLNLQIVLHELEADLVKVDIETYLRAALAPMQPSEAEITALIERADILFIYASTVVRFIGYDNFGRNPRLRLQSILASSKRAGSPIHDEMDSLYRRIIEEAIDDLKIDSGEREDIRQVLYTVICAQEQLAINVIAELLQIDHSRVYAALRPLWSVLHVNLRTGIVTPLHKSFPDYMLDFTRSQGYWCNEQVHHCTLSRLCFDLIKRVEVHFNICGLKSSYQADKDVPDLENRVRQKIPLPLYYACRYWGVHLDLSGNAPELSEPLEYFISVQLLLWIEIMNLKKYINEGGRLIKLAEGWCARQGCSDRLAQLLQDAWHFTTTFGLNPVSQSTPHLYVSMMLFRPHSTPIFDNYARRVQRMIEPSGSAIEQRQFEYLARWPFKHLARSFALSRDGKLIVLGGDNTVMLVSAFNGRVIWGPLAGHANWVTSVGFSPDGRYTISGSEDTTIRIWETQSGKLLHGPLKAHNSPITTVLYSPNGKHFVSASRLKTDNPIRVWDAETAEVVFNLTGGHTDWIASLSFSPDSTQLISGSRDHKLCLWDIGSRRKIRGSFGQHTDTVTSVEFSLDGTRIVSGSLDKTICIWNAKTMELMIGPLCGHTDQVMTVSFSPDSTLIASGSRDKSIRIWDAQKDGELVLGPLEGHGSIVTRVTFTHDGNHIISGSSDETICTWDACSKREAANFSKGHSGWVSSVSFSPDGKRIVSGSYDRTVIVWDIEVKGLANQSLILKGHTNIVLSVAFSPHANTPKTYIASGSADRSVRVWDAQSGRLALALTGHQAAIRSVTFSPDGNYIVSGSDDGVVCVWTVSSGENALGFLGGHQDSVTSVQYSPDGRLIASGSRDKSIRIWNVQSGEITFDTIETHSEITSIGFSPDSSQVVSGSSDQTICVWDIQSRERVLGPLLGHTGQVLSVSFSPDGTFIASGSEDKTLRIWSATSGELLLGPIQGHIKSIRSIHFSPDGDQLVSGSNDETIRVHDIRSVRGEGETVSPLPPRWSLNEDGWVIDERGRLLTWVPHNFHSALMRPNTNYLISRSGYLRLEIRDIPEDSWASCFAPN